MPRKLQILAIFGDPRNFIVSKVPCYTVSCLSLKNGGKLYYTWIKSWQGCRKQYLIGQVKLTSIFQIVITVLGWYPIT